MKFYFISFVILISLSLSQEKINENVIESAPFYNYSLNKVNKDDFPKSIIFIIADGTGIGHYTLSYYSNKEFPFREFDH